MQQFGRTIRLRPLRLGPHGTAPSTRKRGRLADFVDAGALFLQPTNRSRSSASFLDASHSPQCGHGKTIRLRPRFQLPPHTALGQPRNEMTFTRVEVHEIPCTMPFAFGHSRHHPDVASAQPVLIEASCEHDLFADG